MRVFARLPTTLAAFAVAATLVSCSGDGPSAPRETPARLEPVGALSETAEVGADLAGPRVLVRGSRGGVLKGIAVRCTVVSGTSTLSVASVTSGVDGSASCGRWALPQRPELTSVRVAATGIDSVTFSMNVRPGPPFQLGFQRGVTGDVFSGLLVDPPPILEVQDRFANRLSVASVGVTARSNVPSIVIYGGTAQTTSDGRATFTRLGLAGPSEQFVLSFDAAGLQPAVGAPKTLQPAPPGAAVPVKLEFRTDGPKVVVLDPGERSAVPPLDAVNAAGIPIPFALSQLMVRSPSLATLSGDTSLVGTQAGQTFVVARSVADTMVVDSLLLHVTRSPGGPLLYTDLSTFSISTGTDVEVRVFVDLRSGGSLAGANIDVTYPRSFPALLSLLSVTPVAATSVTISPTAGLVRLAYAVAGGSGGATEIARLRFRANFATPNFGQIVLTPVQIVSATLQDLTLMTTAMNPPFVIRQ